MKIQYEIISKAVARGYFLIEREHIPGWTQDAITDAVCNDLEDCGIDIIDVPANCLVYGKTIDKSPTSTKMD